MYWDVADRSDVRVDGSYYQLNIGGMGRTVAAMESLNMVFHSASAPTRAEWNALPRYVEDENEDGGPEFRVACDALLARLAAEERPGIPIHKLYSTNDGWHVQPIEILGALHQYERAKEADAERVRDLVGSVDWWDTWLDYIARAAREGNGFRVR